MKRNIVYSLGVVLFAALTGMISAGAVSSWTTTPAAPAAPAAPVVSGTPASSVEPVASAELAAPAAPAASGNTHSATDAYIRLVKVLYGELTLAETGLDLPVFSQALTGFYNLKARGRVPGGKEVLSIVDFTKSSQEKRLWIIDLAEKKLLYHTLVAHGKGSGGDRATRFSNTVSSHQSSLGFYVTGEVYYGKHGRSLRLDGMDPGFNSKARDRAIVLHGADYVSQSFIRRAGRLGRSFGCPAVPVSLSSGIIDQIKEKTVLFIHGPGDFYRSSYLDTKVAADYSRREAEPEFLAEFNPPTTSLSSP